MPLLGLPAEAGHAHELPPCTGGIRRPDVLLDNVKRAQLAVLLTRITAEHTGSGTRVRKSHRKRRPFFGVPQPGMPICRDKEEQERRDSEPRRPT